MRTVEIVPTFEAWQVAARGLLRERVLPAEVQWRELPGGAVGMLAPESASAVGPSEATAPATRVPRKFLEVAAQAAGAGDPARWSVLYEVLWRLVNERRDLLDDARDPAVRRLKALSAQAWRQGQQTEIEEMRRVEAAGGARPFVPAGAGLPELAAAAARCTGCDLYRQATQTVFGRGPADARIVMVGEQPGDQEDLKGAPFVGPAGEVLDRALREAGIARERLYVTNAVKHFKFVERGRRRIHQTPRLGEIAACIPWLEAELDVIKPEILVCLGATAGRAVFGPDFRLLRERGRFLPSRFSAKTLATLHPSAVLRGRDDAEQARLYGMLLEDVRVVGAA